MRKSEENRETPQSRQLAKTSQMLSLGELSAMDRMAHKKATSSHYMKEIRDLLAQEEKLMQILHEQEL